eukprot:SAG22_NODE_255_length_13562_cov_6.101463_9_plen_161_part_00
MTGKELLAAVKTALRQPQTAWQADVEPARRVARRALLQRSSQVARSSWCEPWACSCDTRPHCCGAPGAPFPHLPGSTWRHQSRGGGAEKLGRRTVALLSRPTHFSRTFNSVLRPKYLGEGSISRVADQKGTFLGRPRSSLLNTPPGRCPHDHFTALRAPY